MFAPLEKIKISSIYGGDLPDRMAKCTPDMLTAIRSITADLDGLKTKFVLSDLYRSYEMQLQAHLDWVTKKKKAYSPAPGGSMHEAGRAFDMDLDELKKIDLADFWEVAENYAVVPIIDTPTAGKSESWHFDRRGSHDLVYRYYKSGKASNFDSAYHAMAASAIVSTGQKVDALGNDPLTGYIQSGVIRLGGEIGAMDGRIGPKTRTALQAMGIDPMGGLQQIGAAVETRLQEKFPQEYFVENDGTLPLAVTTPTTFVVAAGAGATKAASYAPNTKNKAALGKAADLLQHATVLSQSFKLQPKYIATLPGGQLYFDSELQLDTDGWPDGKGKGDPSWQPDTSLRYKNGTSVNSNAVPYMVLPNSAKWVSGLGIRLGDYAAVLYKGVLAFAVFADGGPNNKIGEGSIQLLRAIGEERIKASGKVLNAGAGPDIVTIVFPGSRDDADLKDEATLLAAIKAKGKSLFDAISK